MKDGDGAEVARAELDNQLAAAVAHATAAWPGLDVDAASFAKCLEERVRSEGTFLATAHVDDLYLAHACARGNPAALHEFEDRFMTRVPTYVARFRMGQPFVDELQQLLRHKLFIATDEAAPKIAEYSGMGALERWFRICVVNTALKLTRRGRVIDADELTRMGEAASAPDPELDLVKRRYSSDFEAAFREALAGLSPRQRNVLRLHFVDGLSIDAIGAVHHVHRATAARWLASARTDVLEGTRSTLRKRLDLTATEFDSLVAVVQSRLDVSLRVLLASGA